MKLELFESTEGYILYEVSGAGNYVLCEVGFAKDGRFGGHITFFDRESRDYPVNEDTNDYNEIKARAVADYNRLKEEGLLEEYW